MTRPSSPSGPPRLVLDTNVWLDLLVFADPRVAALADALRGRRVLAISRADCRDEWRRVLGYPRLALDAATQATLIARHDALVVPIPDDAALPARLPRCADRDDQKFLELAAQGGAAALLSRDAALLALARRTRRDGLFAIVPPWHWREVLDAPVGIG